MIYAIKKTGWLFFAIIVMLIAWVMLFRADWMVIPPFEKVSAATCAGYPGGVCESCTIGQCGGKDATPPDPNRPSFDLWGNEWSYDGKLIQTGQCPYTDPISQQANPYCPADPVQSSTPVNAATTEANAPDFQGK